MNTLACLLFFLIPSTENAFPSGPGITEFPRAHFLSFPDSLRERQALYNGVLWQSGHRRIAGDPYLFTNVFLPGEVTFNGRKFSDIKIRYDIFSDEIMVPRDLDQIIRLNREMVDGFSIVFSDRVHRFINADRDSSGGLTGYVNLLYRGRSALYVKYRKKIFTEISSQSDGEFYQVHTIHLLTDGAMYELTKLKDLLKISGDAKGVVRDFVKESRIRVNRKIPESFVPVVRFYDTLKD